MSGKINSDDLDDAYGISYLAPIKDRAYVLSAISYNGPFTVAQERTLKNDVIDKITFSEPTNLYNESESESDSYFTVNSDSKPSTENPTGVVNITLVIGIAIIIAVVVFVIIKNRKQKLNIIDENSKESLSFVEDKTNKEQKSGTKELPVEALRDLKTLYDSGILTDEEYTEKKKQLLGL